MVVISTLKWQMSHFISLLTKFTGTSISRRCDAYSGGLLVLEYGGRTSFRSLKFFFCWQFWYKDISELCAVLSKRQIYLLF